MFSANKFRSFLWLVSVCVVLNFALSGCGGYDEDKPWVGSWNLETVDGENWKLIIAVFGGTIEDRWTFNDDGTWELETTVTILGEKESNTGSGTYTLTDDTYSMVATDPDFVIFDFGFTVEVVEDDSSDSESTEETGTWVRDGDTLTLTTSDGQVLVFKKL